MTPKLLKFKESEETCYGHGIMKRGVCFCEPDQFGPECSEGRGFGIIFLIIFSSILIGIGYLVYSLVIREQINYLDENINVEEKINKDYNDGFAMTNDK